MADYQSYLNKKRQENQDYSDQVNPGEPIRPYRGIGKYIKHYKKYNKIFLEGTLEALSNYMDLPTIIVRDFKKFIEDFYSVCTDFTLIKICSKEKGVYCVTVIRHNSKEVLQIVWIEKSFESGKSIDITTLNFLRKMLVKYKAVDGIMVTTNRLNRKTSVSIRNSRYNILVIDKIMLKNICIALLKKIIGNF